MNKNIILAGVGGQGILTIAAIIDHAAMTENLFLKQAEVHGMSQRGGAVQSHLRLSDTEIFSDLIPLGQADLIISLEPMEALRYLPYLSGKGTIISANKAFKNIAHYPAENEIIEAYHQNQIQHLLVDVEAITAQVGNPKSANVVMAGAAQRFIGIDYAVFIESIKIMFASKGDTVVAQNLEAFELGSKIKNNR